MMPTAFQSKQPSPPTARNQQEPIPFGLRGRRSLRGFFEWPILVPLIFGLLFTPQWARGQTAESVVTGLFEPHSVAVDLATHTYFITDNTPGYNGIVQFDPVTGLFQTLGANELSSPQGIVLDHARGGLVVAEAGRHLVTLVTWEGRVIPLAGDPLQRGPQDGIGVAARLNAPAGLAIDAEGNIYIADALNHAIRKLDPHNQLTTLATGFNRPAGVAVGPDETLFVADTGNHVIKQIDLKTSAVTVIAGSGLNGAQDAPSALNAEFNGPRSLIWVGGNTGLLVGDSGNHSIRRIAKRNAASSWSVETFAGKSGLMGLVNGTFIQARFNEPAGLVLDAEGAVLVCDLKNYELRRLVRPPATTPLLSPDNGHFHNAVSLNITNRIITANTTFRFTLDGSDPTPVSAVFHSPHSIAGGSVLLKVRGFSPDYGGSSISSNVYSFFVSDPLVEPQGGHFNNPVPVTAFSLTDNTVFRFSTNHHPPTAQSPVWTNGSHAMSGPFQIRGFREGFEPSIVASNSFHFEVDAPQILVRSPARPPYINSAHLIVTNRTADSDFYYTLDGTDPTPSSPRFGAEVILTTTNQIKVAAFKPGFTPSPMVAAAFPIEVDAPKLSPSGGFFPNGTKVTVTVERPDAVIFYTTNGNDPTENDHRYTAPINVDQLQFSVPDLRFLKVRAFAPDTQPSAVVSGEVTSLNLMGVSRDSSAGVGATIVIPVVASLQQDQLLRSFQFNLKVTPNQPGTPPLASLRALNSSSFNDFVQVNDGAENEGVSSFGADPFQTGNTLGLAFSVIGTNDNFAVRNYAMVALVALTIPPDAVQGQSYRIELTDPSGTSDGLQGRIPIEPMEPRVITVQNVPYLVGDSSPGAWYNAGEFGDGRLDNSDVNNAFYASLGVRTPFPFSDAFDAMDAYPEDTPGVAGGDGLIRFLDWQVIFLRSLRHDPSNWIRSWSPTGRRIALGAVSSAANSPADETVPAPGAVWVRDALLSASSLGNVAPGEWVHLPVHISLAPGKTLSGFQFRAAVEALESAPALSDPVQFIPAPGFLPPKTVPSLLKNQAGMGWPLGSFEPELKDRQLLGHLRFRVPPPAAPGMGYALSFSHVDGAPAPGPDGALSQYDFESLPASITVQQPLATSLPLVTPEWQTHFFGASENPEAHPDADPDQDGIPNWQEFLAGTDPSRPDSRLKLSTPERRPDNSVVLSWLSAPGKRYVVEFSPELAGGNWIPLGAEVLGDGHWKELTELNPNEETRFYRVRLRTDE
jgi:hypothetical protein